MIILEGADNLGKSTAAKTLADILADRMDQPCPVIPHGPPVNALGEYHRDTLAQFAVHDRGHLGWLVWQGLLGCDGQAFDGSKFNGLVSGLRRQRAMVVVLSAADDWYIEREMVSGRPEMYEAALRISANRIFRELRFLGTGRHHLVDIHHRVDQEGFPDINHMTNWVNAWYVRQREALP